MLFTKVYSKYCSYNVWNAVERNCLSSLLFIYVKKIISKNSLWYVYVFIHVCAYYF